MKVLVLSNRVPFVHGGAEELAHHLVQQLRGAGHEAEAMRLPFAWQPAERLYDEMLIARSLKVVNVDRVIALKFPVYLVPHPQRVVWLLHQFRQAYDLFEAGLSHLTNDPADATLRAAINAADMEAFRTAHRLFAIAEATTRLARYNGITAETLSAPLNDPELFTGGEAGGYILAAGRITSGKRQALLVRALQYAPRVRLVVAGPPEEASFAAELAALAESTGVADRVTFDLRFLPRGEIASLVNNCTASAYIPFQEDSVGYVTMEAFHAGKPVITTTDAGGVLDIVRDGDTGLVTLPDPRAIADAMVQMTTQPASAARMGRAGRALLAALDLTWPKTLERLLA